MPFRSIDVVPHHRSAFTACGACRRGRARRFGKVADSQWSRGVALIDAKRLDYYHALEAEQADLESVLEAQRGLEDILAGRTLTLEELRARFVPSANDG